MQSFNPTKQNAIDNTQNNNNKFTCPNTTPTTTLPKGMFLLFMFLLYITFLCVILNNSIRAY